MGMNGITFRGVHSRQLGLIARAVTRPIAPPVRVIEEALPYRDGTIDYSEQNGRLFYDDKVIEIEFIAPRESVENLTASIAQVVKWLSGSWGDLIYDDMPEVKWRAKPIDLSSLTTELFRVGRFTVQFRCKPFNALTWDTLGPLLDDMVPVGSDVALDYGGENIYNLPMNGKYEISHLNHGDVAVRPKINIVGCETNNGRQIDININGVELRLTLPSTMTLGDGDVATIDCNEFCAYCKDIDLTPCLSAAGGVPDFPELIPGENEIVIETEITGHIEIEYCDLFFFGRGGVIN